MTARWTDAVRRVGFGLACILAGAAIGFGATAAVVRAPALPFLDDRIGNDHWVGSRLVGSTEAHPYLRARVAVQGPLALANSEAVYLTRSIDERGRPLREDCDYDLSAGSVPAQWWSVTVYDDQAFLARNGDEAHSALFADGMREGGPATVRLSRNAPRTGRWMSLAGTRRPTLTLRLYRPDLDRALAPRPGWLPRVTRLGCEDGT